MKTICVDFDGVIHSYSKGWQDGQIYDKPIDGVREALQKFLDDGYEVVIFTTRADDRVINGVLQKNQRFEVIKYLEENGIPYTRLHYGVGKPLYSILIDDNAYRFAEDWSKTVSDVKQLLQTKDNK